MLRFDYNGVFAEYHITVVMAGAQSAALRRCPDDIFHDIIYL